MNWKVEGQYSKNTKIVNRWGVHDPSSSYGGAAPGYGSYMTIANTNCSEGANKTVNELIPIIFLSTTLHKCYQQS